MLYRLNRSTCYSHRDNHWERYIIEIQTMSINNKYPVIVLSTVFDIYEYILNKFRLRNNRLYFLDINKSVLKEPNILKNMYRIVSFFCKISITLNQKFTHHRLTLAQSDRFVFEFYRRAEFRSRKWLQLRIFLVARFLIVVDNDPT